MPQQRPSNPCHFASFGPFKTSSVARCVADAGDEAHPIHAFAIKAAASVLSPPQPHLEVASPDECRWRLGKPGIALLPSGLPARSWKWNNVVSSKLVMMHRPSTVACLA